MKCWKRVEILDTQVTEVILGERPQGSEGANHANISTGRAFQAEGTACEKVLRREPLGMLQNSRSHTGPEQIKQEEV